MSEWKIYHSDGSALTDANGKAISTRSIDYSGTWMGDCFVTVSFKNEVPIEFSIGDYLVYRDERFEINYDPGKIKCSRPNTYGEAFKYNEVKFNALSDELVRAEFLDVVLYDNQLHYTSLPKFAFYASSLDDLLDRLQANMNEQYGDGTWHFFSRNKARSIQRGCTEADWNTQYGEGTEDNIIESQSLSASSNTCWEALAWVNSTFDVNFIIRGRNVYVGTAGIPTNNIFKYGKGNGLYELEQNAESDQLVCTRLRAYGSTKNLPSRYYAELGLKYASNVASVINNDKTAHKLGITLDLDYKKRYFSTSQDYTVNSTTQSRWKVVLGAGGTTVTGAIYENEITGKCVFYTEYSTTQEGYESSLINLTAFQNALSVGTQLELVQGFTKINLPTTTKIYNEGMLPDNMAINTLMLPGFPKSSLQEWWDAQTDEVRKCIYDGDKKISFSENKYRPYVDSPNKEIIGVRPASVFFDTDDETNGIIEIYPTIEEMEVDGVRIDEINEGSEQNVTDNGVFSDGDTIPNFAIYLSPNVNFDINDLKDDDFTIHIKDGMCGGREFKVAASKKENGRWKLTLERQLDNDLDLYFPYKDFPIKAGDHFVLTGIELPDEYVDAASQKLLKYAIAYLNENDYTRYVYSPKVDEIFMARQHDKAIGDTTGKTRSLYLTLKEGDIMLFKDDDLGIDAEICIDQLSIKEEEGKLPTYEITLREDKEVSTIQKIKNQVSSLVSGNGGSGSGGVGITSAQVKQLIEANGADHFLSKTDDDEAEGLITFDKGLDSKGDVNVGDKWGISKDGEAKLSNTTTEEVKNAAATVADRTLVGGKGFDMYVDANGQSHLWVDELMVRVKAYFASLEIRKVSYSGGTTIFSNAGSTICKVVEVTSEAGVRIGWKCYAVADDGSTRTMNWWKVGDQALCQTFNIASGVYDGVENQYYWRLVLGAGQEVLEDGRVYDYVLLSDVASFAPDADIIPASSLKTLAYEKGGSVTELEWAGVSAGVTTSDGWTSLLKIVAQMVVDGEATEADFERIKATAAFAGYASGSGTPMVGDVIVQAGSQVFPDERGNVIMLSTSTEDGSDAQTAPSMRMWHGISGYQWTGLTCIISPEIVKFSTRRFELFSSSDGSDSSPVVTYKGDWNASTQYGYYDQVSHEGQLWTWMNAEEDPAKGTAPSVAAGWTLTVQKGADGANGTMKEIVLDSGLAIVSADADGTISDISQVSGLPVSVSVSDGGEAVPCSKWTASKCWVKFNGQSETLDASVTTVKSGLAPSGFTSGDTGATVKWALFVEKFVTGETTWPAVAGNITVHIEYADSDGKTVVLERTVAVGVTRDGAKGDTGASGSDTWTVETSPAIVTVRGTELTESGNVFELSVSRAVYATVMHGQTQATVTGVKATTRYCSLLGSASVTDDGKARAQIGSIVRHEVEGVSGVYVPYSTAYVTLTLTAKDGDETAEVSVTVAVETDYTAHIGTLITTDTEFKSQIAELQEKDSQLKGSISKIEQHADSIELSVTELGDNLTKSGIDLDAHTITLQSESVVMSTGSLRSSATMSDGSTPTWEIKGDGSFQFGGGGIVWDTTTSSLSLNGTFKGVLMREAVRITSDNWEDYITAETVLGKTVYNVELEKVGSYVIFDASLDEVIPSGGGIYVSLPCLPDRDYDTDDEFEAAAQYARTFVGCRIMMYNYCARDVIYSGLLWNAVARSVKTTDGMTHVVLDKNDTLLTVQQGQFARFDCQTYLGLEYASDTDHNHYYNTERIVWEFTSGAMASKSSYGRIVYGQ